MNSNWKTHFVSAIGAFAAMICLTIAATTPLANAATFVAALDLVGDKLPDQSAAA